ncbi:MAG: hypothetical protein A3G87_09225 [Omnitrophica bacterium RIFCSPLOWO2_12_FULL_50_11]|nr:MAG: hypothetical protein A3G87_09225 [Omnitrophica bacterium RIFCSPLOWO2_12_FULL_50_11]
MKRKTRPSLRDSISGEVEAISKLRDCFRHTTGGQVGDALGRCLAMTVCLLPFFTFCSLAFAESSLPRYSRVPDFNLIERSGDSFARADIDGTVWIADFIFTRCQGMCPLLTGRMSNLQNELAGAPVNLISFTVDPDYDRPEVLTEYAEKYGAQEGKWFFLTGAKHEIRELMTGGFHLGVQDATPEDLQAGAEPVMHSSRFVLIDRSGFIRGYYNTDEPQKLRALVKDALTLASPPSRDE